MFLELGLDVRKLGNAGWMFQIETQFEQRHSGQEGVRMRRQNCKLSVIEASLPSVDQEWAFLSERSGGPSLSQPPLGNTGVEGPLAQERIFDMGAMTLASA